VRSTAESLKPAIASCDGGFRPRAVLQFACWQTWAVLYQITNKSQEKNLATELTENTEIFLTRISQINADFLVIEDTPACRDPEVSGLPPRDRDFALLRLRSASLCSAEKKHRVF
jgi:hypothetical protein